MNTNFSLKFKKVDLIVIIISLIVSISFLLSVLFINNTFSKNDKYVVITLKNQELTSLRTNLNSLNSEKEITLTKSDYPSLKSDIHITLNKDKGVRVHDINCLDHTCEKQGWINVPGMSILCLYNEVKIDVVTSSSGGEIIVGGVIYEI